LAVRFAPEKRALSRRRPGIRPSFYPISVLES
jgi:hypothetical protein